MSTSAPETLTFFFSDIQGSTRLLESLGQEYSAILTRHRAILRDTFSAHGGREMGTEGDSFFAVFEEAAGALNSAISAQRTIAGEQWPRGATVRVRIGLHTGRAEQQGDDLVGLDVHRAARIMAAAHGGQIVISEATLQALGEDADGVVLKELGQHRLRDLSGPERLLQVSVAGLDSSFPPPRTVETIPNNLPAQATELIGRHAELDHIQSLLNAPGTRLITLVGPGGIGKTRLAVQAAADQIHAFDDGAYFADLALATDVEGMLDVLIRALRVSVPADGAPDDAIIDHLRPKAALLVLDNFEQLVDAGVEVTKILSACPRVQVLVTSRESLRLRGERLVPIEPLGLPAARDDLTAVEAGRSEAVRLFVARAEEAIGGFDLTDENAPAIGEVCARLDGLPLAIELAAASLRILSPAELRDRLVHQLDVSSSGPRDLPDRQRTLRGTIEWSHDLLNAGERQLFAVLSLFSSATTDAVQEVAASIPTLAELDVLATMSSLVDKSLARSETAGGGRRLVMLETIRRYAAEKLADAPDLAAAATEAHAAHYARFAAESQGARQGSGSEAAIDRLALELENLEAAWRYFLDRADITQLNVLAERLWLVHEGRGWYHRIVALANDLLEVIPKAKPTPEQADDEVTLRLSLARALLAMRGYTPEVERLYQEALDVTKAGQAAPRRLAVLRSLGSFYLYRSQVDRTAEIGHQLLQLAEETGDRQLELEGRMMVGPATAFMGDAKAGLEHIRRAMELFDPDLHRSAPFRLGPSPGVAAPIVAALFRWWLGQPDTAKALGVAAIEMADRLGHPYTAAYAYFHVAVLDIWNRDHATAGEHAKRVVELARRHDYRIWLALGMVVEGVSQAALSDPAQGLERVESGVALYEGIQTPPVFWPLVLSLKADAYARAGKLPDAVSTLDQALGLAGERNWLTASFIAQKGDVLLTSAKSEEGVATIRRAADEAKALGARMIQLRALTRLCASTDGRQRDDAGAELAALLDQFEEGADNPDVRDARLTVAAAGAA